MIGAVTAASPAIAQIQRHPTGVNVNAQGATTVFITFSALDGYVAVEALWCGALIPAAPDIGERCDPATLFGSLPLRFDQTRQSGVDALTDIMSIPPSVARRAYQAAADGEDSRFFYVRRLVDPTGARPDQYITVTCRLTDGGARAPFALLDVRLRFASGQAVASIAPGREPAPIEAEIAYNGTGRLVGRWEIVRPGEEPPTSFDLLTEGTLPLELRGTQRRYTELARFNLFLPPGGRITLEGPPTHRLPVDASGLHQVLLRIEATDDKEGDSNLAGIGAGEGLVHSGAVAGFPIPVLRYIVGAPGSTGTASERLRLLLPAADSTINAGRSQVFSWTHFAAASLYRLEVREERGNSVVLSALLQSSTAVYRSPAWLADRISGDVLEWRVVGLDSNGERIEATAWRRLRILR
jgi:hypothetical protein